MGLTPKQEAFCLAYVETGNASEAYRRSYDVSRMKDASVNRLAKANIDNLKIASRIRELMAPAVEKAQITLDTHLADLKRLRDKAEQEGKYGPAVAAEVSRGKAAGLYLDRVDMNVTQKSPLIIQGPPKSDATD